MNIKNLVTKIIKNFIFQRLALTGFIFLSMMLIAKILPDKFGELAFFLSLVKLMLIGNLGSLSGYIFFKYNMTDDSFNDNYFLFTYNLQLIIISILFLFISYF